MPLMEPLLLLADPQLMSLLSHKSSALSNPKDIIGQHLFFIFFVSWTTVNTLLATTVSTCLAANLIYVSNFLNGNLCKQLIPF